VFQVVYLQEWSGVFGRCREDFPNITWQQTKHSIQLPSVHSCISVHLKRPSALPRDVLFSHPAFSFNLIHLHDCVPPIFKTASVSQVAHTGVWNLHYYRYVNCYRGVLIKGSV